MHAIVAMTKEGLIGVNGVLPWYVPEDIDRFRTLTLGGQVIMGRRTFVSLGLKNGLENRINIVISNTLIPRKSVFLCDNRDQAVSLARNFEGYRGAKSWVIGGAQVYEALMPDIDVFDVTHLKYSVAGPLPPNPVYMPESCMKALEQEFSCRYSFEVPWGTIAHYVRQGGVRK